MYEHHIWDYESVWPNVSPKNKVGHCDPYFMVHWFLPYILRTSWCMNIIIWDYESVWPDVWPKDKWRSPIFYGPAILCYILKNIWCMNTILWDYGQYDPMFDLKINVGHRPIFHGPVILPYISKTIWWMSVIFSDNETVWPKLWPLNKCRSAWTLFHGLVILLNTFKII